MEYSWNIKELKRKKLLASLYKGKRYLNQYQSIINSIDIKKDNFNKEDILVIDEIKNISFDEAIKMFSAGLEYVPEDLYEIFTDVFICFEDIYALSETFKYEKINISNDELINICYEIISSMGIREYIEYFEQIINPNKHILNIQEEMPSACEGISHRVGGVTYIDPLFDKSYINIFRSYTIQDIEYLIHESFHAIYNHILRDKGIKSPLLNELEGLYASIYTNNYLSHTQYKDEALKSRKDEINTQITNSYLLMINHILYITSRNKEFKLDKANEYLDSLSDTTKIKILPEELDKYLSVIGFELIEYMFGYFTALDLISLNDIEYSDRMLLKILSNDSDSIMDNLRKHNVTFMDDGLNNFINEYNLTRRIK